MNMKITVSAPGRICLFGEHQDYLGLPVIAAAVNLRATLRAEPQSEPLFLVDKPDIGEQEIIDFTKPIVYEKPRDYFKSGVCVLQKNGAVFKQGYRITLTSAIPIGKGCSGSSAILVAWVGLLSKISERGQGENIPSNIAQLAYEAEVLEFNEPGGIMDHFASALGGVQYIETTGEYSTEALPPPRTGAFVLGDSLEPKDTTGILARVRENATAGIDYLKKKNPDFDLATADMVSAETELGADVSEPVRRAVLGNLRNRDIKNRALEMFRADAAGTPELGELLDAQHAILRDDLDISTPKIEKLIAAAKQAGAAGCKINGSGGGGCMFAFCMHDPQKVARAIESAGGKAYIIKIDNGFMEGAK